MLKPPSAQPIAYLATKIRLHLESLVKTLCNRRVERSHLRHPHLVSAMRTLPVPYNKAKPKHGSNA
jgi:hypothetical protein